MPRRSPYRIVLTKEEERSLASRVRKYTLPHYSVVRARIVLLAAEGLDNKEIGRSLNLPRENVSRWRRRFFQGRLDGLEDLSRPGRPRSFSPSRGGGGKSSGL
jgi:hypothetical protein